MSKGHGHLLQRIADLQADLDNARHRVNTLEALLEQAEWRCRQEAALLERAVARQDELHEELMRVTQQELPLDE